ncbi:MAG: hypothetical protein U9N30_00790 [Campylobacterota bacterium]|nr:hypothetical protein [Campylobacterota bacterium]
MKELCISLFSQFPALIVFLHVISAVIWVGGMIAIRFAVHYSMAKVEDPTIKLGRTLEFLQRFFNMVRPAIAVLLVTAVIMIFGLEFKGTPLYNVIIIKEVIWSLMTVVFIIIYVKRNKAQISFDSGDFAAAKAQLAPLSLWMIPLNIVLGIVALYLGITLRGF